MRDTRPLMEPTSFPASTTLVLHWLNSNWHDLTQPDVMGSCLLLKFPSNCQSNRAGVVSWKITAEDTHFNLHRRRNLSKSNLKQESITALCFMTT